MAKCSRLELHSLSQHAFSGSGPDHDYFLKYLQPTSVNFVNDYGDDDSCLDPTDLTTTLYMSNHLSSQYMYSTNFSLERARKQAQFSLELIASSKMTHSPRSALHSVRKTNGFRPPRSDFSFQRKFIEAERFWREQTIREQATLGPQGPWNCRCPHFLAATWKILSGILGRAFEMRKTSGLRLSPTTFQLICI